MRLKTWLFGLGCLLIVGCSSVPKNLGPEELARIPTEQMGPVNQARADLAKAEDEVGRRSVAVQSAKNEVEVARPEVKVAESELDRAKALLNKATFDRNSQAGQQAQRDVAMYQAQLDAAQAHLKAANAAVELANAQKTQAEAQHELAKTKVQFAEATALQNSGDPAGKNVNIDSIRSSVDDRLKDVEKTQTDIARLQSEAERERMAWQIADQHYKQMRGVGGGK
jgi:hypothetical protein